MMDPRTVRSAALAGALVLGVAFVSSAARADALLSGTVTAVAGAPMGGATVSAKADGATITTTVFSDASGHYYFPALPNGHYRVWAQALSFATAIGTVDLAANSRQNFTLTPLTGDYFQQLPGDLAMASLPATTPKMRCSRRSSRTTAPVAISRTIRCSTVSMLRAGAPSST